MRGSWPWLALFCLVFLAGFFLLRSQSAVLAAEAEAPAMRVLAVQNGLEPASVLALRAVALELDEHEFAARVGEFARQRAVLGEPLAAVAIASPSTAAVASEWVKDAGDAPAAFELHRCDPVAYPGVVFEQLRERFRARSSGRQQ